MVTIQVSHFIPLCNFCKKFSVANFSKFFHASVLGSVIFESKVSALFWAVYLEEASVEIMSGLLPSAQYLYEELMLTPYMARVVVLHKPHSPHAWCDSLRVLCVTDDKAEAWGDVGSNHAWTTLVTSDEMEITAGSHLTCRLEGRDCVDLTKFAVLPAEHTGNFRIFCHSDFT